MLNRNRQFYLENYVIPRLVNHNEVGVKSIFFLRGVKGGSIHTGT